MPRRLGRLGPDTGPVGQRRVSRRKTSNEEAPCTMRGNKRAWCKIDDARKSPNRRVQANLGGTWDLATGPILIQTPTQQVFCDSDAARSVMRRVLEQDTAF